MSEHLKKRRPSLKSDGKGYTILTISGEPIGRFLDLFEGLDALRQAPKKAGLYRNEDGELLAKRAAY